MRLPAVAGRFYPSDEQSLTESIEHCFGCPLGPGMPGRTGSDRSVVAAMVPHAGYPASGMNAARAYRAIKEDGLPEAYVIIGPDHYGLSPGITICSEGYLTPFGECPVDDDICSALSRSVPDDPAVHRMEHSIEVQVPFIQYIDPDPRIVPVIMGDQSPGSALRLASLIEDACRDRDVIVIASTDMSHYVPKPDAEALDGMVLDAISAMDVDRMYRTVLGNRVSMCGYGPVATAMMLSATATPRMLGHTDSYDSLGVDPDSVVGYASAVFLSGAHAKL